MSLLDSFGVTKLNEQVRGLKYVPGRVAHIDADFVSYVASAETRDELQGLRPRKTLERMYEKAEDYTRHLANMAGARDFVVHLTPPGSNKGNREDQSIQLRYQSGRKEDKPEHLDTVRFWMSENLPSVVHLDQEADDGLAQAAYEDPENNIIVTMDKDLWMVPGWQMNMDTHEINWLEPGDFGWLKVDTDRANKKVIGRGPKWFFQQLLMGDPVDTIQGLPECPGVLKYRVDPTKEYAKNPDIAKDRTFKIGQMLAYKVLEEITDVSEAYNVCKTAYRILETEYGYEYKDWRDGLGVSWAEVFLSEMRLLWMRQTKDPNDVVRFLKCSMKNEAT